MLLVLLLLLTLIRSTVWFVGNEEAASIMPQDCRSRGFFFKSVISNQQSQPDQLTISQITKFKWIAGTLVLVMLQ
jgi:hypothetical protein